MSTVVYATQNQVLDLICSRHYGDESGYVEAVLDANPGLAEYVRLPLGTPVTLPDLPIQTDRLPVITLWD